MSMTDLSVRIAVDMAQFSNDMKAVEGKLKGLGDGVKGIGKKMAGVGTALTASITAPVVGLLGASVKIGTSFEKQLSEVEALLGASKKEMDALKDSALELGASTAFSAQEIAEAQAELASAGFTANQILDASAGVADLAASSNISLAEAAAIASGAIASYGFEAKDAARVSDIMAKAAAVSNAGALDLGATYEEVAATANGYGITIEDLTAATGILANSNIKGSKAATVLKNGFNYLNATTGSARDTLDKYGINVFDTSGKMSDMAGIVTELNDKLGGLNDQDKMAALSSLFGSEAANGWLVLMEQGAGKITEMGDALRDADGEAARMAKTMMDNLSSAWGEFGGTLETLGIQIYDILAPALKKIVQYMSDVAEKFTKTSPETKKFLIIVGLLVATIPLLILGIGGTIAVFGMAFSAISGALIPIGLLIGAVGALIAVFGKDLKGTLKKLQGYIKPVVTAFTYLTGGMKDSVKEGKKAGKSLEEILGPKAFKIVQTFNKLKENMIQTFNTLKKVLTPVIMSTIDFVREKFTGIISWWKTEGGGIISAVKRVFSLLVPIVIYVWGMVIKVIGSGIEFVKSLISFVANVINGDWKSAWGNLGTLIMNGLKLAWDALSLFFISGIPGLIKMGIKAIPKLLAKLPGLIKTSLKFVYDLIVKSVSKLSNSSVFGNIATGFLNVLKSVQGFFGKFVSKLSDISWTNVFKKIGTVISTVFNVVVAVIKVVWTVIQTVFGAIAVVIVKLMPLFTAVAKGVVIAVGIIGAVLKILIPVFVTVLTWVGNFVMKSIEFFSKLWTASQPFFQMLWEFIILVFQGVVTVVTALVTFFVDHLLENFLNMWEFVKVIFEAVKFVIVTVFEFVRDYVLPVIMFFVESAITVFTFLWNTAVTIFNFIKNIVMTVFNWIVENVVPVVKSFVDKAIENFWTVWGKASEIFNSLKETVLTIFNFFKEDVLPKFTTFIGDVEQFGQDVIDGATEKFNKVKDAIVGAFEKAWELVSGILEDIQGAVDTVKGAMSYLGGKASSAKTKASSAISSIGSYFSGNKAKKNARGGIFKNETLLGGNNIVGEAGAEVVMPIEHSRYMQPFSNAIANNLMNSGFLDAQPSGVTNQFNINATIREESDIDKIAKKLYELQMRTNRGSGRG